MGQPPQNPDGTCSADIVRESLHIPSGVKLEASIQECRYVSRGQHVYRQNDTASHVYFLLEGVLKAYRVSLDGREGIVRFYYPRELVWTDGASGGTRTMSVMSIGQSKICPIPMTVLHSLMTDYPSVQTRCDELLNRLIAEEQAFVALLSDATAERKLAFLLVQLCRHRSTAELSGLGFSVPMPRADIGNYLGIGVETVSRVFTRLEDRGIVAVRGRKLVLADVPALERIAKGEDTEVPFAIQESACRG